MASSVDVISSCLLGIAGADLRRPAIPTTVELTVWDLVQLWRDPIREGILFTGSPGGDFIDHLKNSLSCTLDFFPQLSGRLCVVRNDVDDGTESYFIDCNNAGAEFIHAVARGVSVSDVVEPKYVPRIVSSSFFPMKETLNCEELWKPLLAVQVTELDDGFFIGCTINHAVADGASFWHFFNSWSEIARGFDTISKAPVFDRWFPRKFVDENSRIRVPPSDKNPTAAAAPPPPLIERVFHFSKESLAELKNKASPESGCAAKISTFQALASHLWRGVTLSRHSENIISEEPQLFILLVDARAKVPLPDSYFGNVIHPTFAVLTKHELLHNGLEFVAGKINELVSRQTREAVIKFVEDWVEKPVINRKGSVKFVIVGSPRFEVYSCDFGYGKPVAWRSGGKQKFDGRVTVYPAAQTGGIDVEVCLSPAAMKALEDDVEFMEAVTI
ncbi:protein ENHANCED PSEUDOMONAS SUSCEPTIBILITY 1-like [Andrographis paniculata]|uniref:protein ENHANCED PSEUDOMONAS SUSCEPTIBILITY 1-like n=1 Tax=Andrographis paniculata TaxID=175694 RepID=UPI0021E97671|nr:protein ENHANCED PSEUDOMONAS SUSCEPTIBILITY 1-like [Andrographis paniculata]